MGAAASFPPVEIVPLRKPEAPRGAPIVEQLPFNRGSAWDSYVLRHPGVTLYHLHAWRGVSERVYNLDTSFLVARDEARGPIRGVLPLFRVPRPLAPYLTNGIFGAYGDILADGKTYAGALVEAAMERIDRGDADYLHLKLLDQVPSGPFRRHDVWVRATLRLGMNENETWASLASAMRTKIRHAQKARLTAHVSRDIDGFYDVLSENMLRKGAPIYGRTFMTTLIEELGPRASILTLRQDGRVVSGAFLAWVNGVMFVPFASSRPAVFSLKANQLLWWEIARHAHALGLHTLDFGSSERDSSGLEFKHHWGATTEPIGSHIHARPGVEPVLTPAGSAIARFTVNAWSHLSVGWAERLGPKVARWIA